MGVQDAKIAIVTVIADRAAIAGLQVGKEVEWREATWETLLILFL